MTATHPWTRAGMGNAPFRMTTEDAAHRALRLGGGFAFCDACGTAISRVYYVKSADGKVSTVGCTCVDKVAEFEPRLAEEVAHVKRAEDRKVAADRKSAKLAKDRARIDAAFARLSDPAVRAALAGQPHPKFAGSSLLAWVEWMAGNAGVSGKLAAAKVVEGVE
jgi:hypothetical protein